MNAAEPQKKALLDEPSALADISFPTHQSNGEGWEQASALALVSIARSLESLATAADPDERGISPWTNDSSGQTRTGYVADDPVAVLDPGQPDEVQVDVAGDIVEISWHERDVLLEELAWVAGSKVIREKFEGVGATGLVALDADLRSRLGKALDDWGSNRLQPDGIARLHAALEREGAASA